MKILALDLGTKTGVAVNWPTSGLRVTATTIRLARGGEISIWADLRKDRRCDPRVIRLESFLRALETPDLVVFEDVQFASYTKQAHLWASFRTVVWLVFAGRSIIECVPVTTLKRFATGTGEATKEQMVSALFKQCPRFRGLKIDDNAVDALWILRWAEQYLSRIPL